MKRQHKSKREIYRRQTAPFEPQAGALFERREPRVYQARIASAAKRSTLTAEALRTFKELAQAEMDARRIVNPIKFCGTCRQLLQTEENFYKSNSEPGGWYWECKACVKLRRASRKQRILDLVWRRNGIPIPTND